MPSFPYFILRDSHLLVLQQGQQHQPSDVEVMDVVVYLALAVLTAVFFFSLFILMMMCKRRAKYMALATSLPEQEMQFSKLQQSAEIDSVLQLNPHLTKMLDNGGRISGDKQVEHCLAILRQCHEVSGELCALWLRQPPSEGLGEHLRTATRRVMPRVDDLLRALALEGLEPRLLEARASALVSALVALVLVYRIAYKQGDLLARSLHAMDAHVDALRLIVDSSTQPEQKTSSEPTGPDEVPGVEVIAVQVHDDCPADPATPAAS